MMSRCPSSSPLCRQREKMTVMAKRGILPLLTASIFYFSQPSAFTCGSVLTSDDASVSSGAETTSTLTSNSTCQTPNLLLHGKLSSRDTFQIATLTTPHRCIHIHASSGDNEDEDEENINDWNKSSSHHNDDDDDSLLFCTDYHDWFDGTNGCHAYSTQKEDWCALYGQMSTTQYTATQACCICGGGWRRKKPRLQVGTYVKLSGYGEFDQCPSLQIVSIEMVDQQQQQQQQKQQQYRYIVQVQKPCGPMIITYDLNNMGSLTAMYQPGLKFTVATDDPKVITKVVRVELRKCRSGTKEQEFVITPMGEEEEEEEVVADEEENTRHRKTNHFLVIAHPLTRLDLSTVLGASSPFFNVTQVFRDGLFDGSEDFFYLKVRAKNDDGRVHWDGTPYDHGHSYLSSGNFGEKEYSMVELHSLELHPSLHREEFSMWQFIPVPTTMDEESKIDGHILHDTNDIDEHAQWLVRTTERIGIDYLEQLSPWHLLDVERDATKTDVKSRFRELSRSFHPDKLVQSNESYAKKDLFEKIFILLQNAYQGLKNADEAAKEQFRTEAESSSQLFARSESVVELLPFHWSKLDVQAQHNIRGTDRYILNVESHLNSTLVNNTDREGESEQIWVVFMYSARCGMSRAVVGMVDLAARNLLKHDNIKVGAYGCGLYKEYPLGQNDPTGVVSDPICAQFKRKETPNVHVIVETISGRDQNVTNENAQFKYFYAAVPNGDTRQFYPHNFIDFARSGKRLWENNHLVHRMMWKEFSYPTFIDNISIVAYLDGTNNDDSDTEIVDAIISSLPTVARRFFNDNVYVGIARCGYGDDEEGDTFIDCSKLNVSWLPDVKVYGVDDNEGISLVRGKFSDVRDVQIAMESGSNMLRMMLGGKDENYDDDLNVEQNDDVIEGGGDCESKQQPPPPDYDLNLNTIDGRMEEFHQLDAPPTIPGDKIPRMPKLASNIDRPRLSGERGHDRNRISGFQRRENRRSGGGRLLGGGSGGFAGYIG